MTIADAYTAFYRGWSPDLSPAANRRYLYDLKRWRKIVGETTIQTIRTTTYSQFRAASATAGHSPETTETTVRTVRQILNCCAASGVLESIPHPGRCRKHKRPAPRAATTGELAALWDATVATTWPHTPTWPTPGAWWRAWIALAYWTGLRMTDLTWKLSAEHVEPTCIRYRASKTGVMHVFPMTDDLRRILAQRQSSASGDSLLRCARSANLLRKHLRRLCSVAGIRKLTPKHFRQAAVTEWSKADSLAAQIIHGVGMPGVLRSYVDPLSILTAAAPRVAWPFVTTTADRQMRLF